MEDVLKTACIIFANRPFLPIELRERQKVTPPPKPTLPPWFDQADHKYPITREDAENPSTPTGPETRMKRREDALQINTIIAL
jgi:hypothetical protein